MSPIVLVFISFILNYYFMANDTDILVKIFSFIAVVLLAYFVAIREPLKEAFTNIRTLNERK